MNKDPQFPDDENGLALRRLAAKGVNLNKVREVEFAVVVTDSDSAESLSSALERMGYRSEVFPLNEDSQGEGGDKWEVIVTCRMKTNHFRS